MQSFFLNYKSSRIHYLKGGRGDKRLVCFHGYGETAGSFAFLESAVGEEFTLIAIDLPFHGQTEWQEGLFFSPKDLSVIIEEIERSTGDPGSRPLFLLGFSLGSRIVLSLLERQPERTGKIILLAPDGLKVNVWYWLATRTRAGNRLFRWTMQHPRWFSLLLTTGRRLGLINPGRYKFASHYMLEPGLREELYRRWTVMRSFNPDLTPIKSLIMTREIPVRLLYGKYDGIIMPRSGERFRQGIDPWCHLSILNAGHRLLQEKHIGEIVTALKD